MSVLDTDFPTYAARMGKPVRALPRATRENVRKHVFEFGGAKHAAPLPLVGREKVVFPGITSSNPLLMDFQDALASTLNTELPVDLDDNMFTATGVYGTFDSLRTCSSFEQSPMSPVMKDNAKLRADMKLPLKYSGRQRLIAQEVWRHVFAEYDVKPLRVTRKSTSGARRFTTDHEIKAAYGHWLLQPSVFEGAMKLVEKDDWLGLFNDYEMAVMYYLGKRTQVDVASKQRSFFDIKYAVSNGARGYTGPVNKDVVIAGRKWEGFAPMRTRTVQGGPWPVNVVNAVSGTGHLQALFRRFPSVFHVCTPEQIEKAVTGYEVYASDVSQYDATMSRDALEVAVEAHAEKWDPRVTKLVRKHLFAAYYTRPLESDGTRGTFVGDILSNEDQVYGGNRSGHHWTALIAKVNKFIDELLVFDAIGMSVVGRTIDFLEGRGELKIVNNGDDSLVLGNGPLFNAYVTARAVAANGHYLVEREAGCVYSGNVLRRVGDRQYKVAPKLTTAFERMYVPERSIGGIMRPYWAIGWLERLNGARLSDAHEHSWDIHNSLYNRLMAPTFGTIASVLTAAVEGMPFAFGGLTSIDKEVLESPDKLHYKYLDTDVSAHILDALTAGIPADTVSPIINIYYKGTINE